MLHRQAGSGGTRPGGKTKSWTNCADAFEHERGEKKEPERWATVTSILPPCFVAFQPWSFRAVPAQGEFRTGEFQARWGLACNKTLVEKAGCALCLPTKEEGNPLCGAWELWGGHRGRSDAPKGALELLRDDFGL